MLIGNGKNTNSSYELTGHGDYENNYGPGVYLDLRRQGKDADGNWLAQFDPWGRETDAVGDTLIGIVNAVGTYTDDTLIGNHQNNELFGMDGNDLMIGGEGNDSLWGANGNDTLEGGLGADFLWGGLGFDIASYENAEQGVNISLRYIGTNMVTQHGLGEEDGDLLADIDGVYGSNYDDTLVGCGFSRYEDYASIHNLLEGRGGNDFIDGLAGNDTLDGGTGNDTLIGGEGNDLLIGGAGDDLIHAGAGDTVDGGAGFDTLLSEDEHLDVTSSTSITNIERIDLTGAGKSLAVNGDAIVKNGVADPAGSGLMSLIVTGDEGDAVHFAGDTWAWTLLDGVRDLGDGKTYRLYEAVKDGQTVRMYVETQVGADSDLNDAPIIACNTVLFVDDAATESLTEHLRTMDDTAGPADLKYFVTHAPAHGELYLNGEAVTDFSDAVFTQDDLDNGRVTFRFVPHAQDTTLVLEDDAFVFTVTDGVNTTGPATFRIHNTTVQVWGTGNDDDLTGVANFDRADTKFHVYGFEGNDTLRGGSGADTLDGGGHAYAQHSPWLYTQEGGDTVDYGASTAAVDVDLTREAQTGGHAEGDVLVGIENVIGSGFGDTITGDAVANFLSGLDGNDTLLGGKGNDTLRGGAGTDLINGGLGSDFADYRTSASWVAVDLNIQDGLTAQSGGGADNDALGDTLIGIEHLIGSNDASHGDVLTGNAASNHLIGLDGDDTLIGGAGNDTLVGGAGADRVDGGTGTRDLADYSASTAWVNVNLNLQDGTTAQSGGGAGNHAEGDILTGIEDVNGSQHDDSLTGNAGSNRIWAYGGNDTVFAGNGADTVHGGDGDDSIDGGGHWDELYGGAGNDTLYGGDSIDTLLGGAGDDVIYGHRSDGGGDGNTDILFGGTGNDTLISLSTGCSTLIGCQGADRIMGGGADLVRYDLTDDYGTANYGKSVYIDLRIQDGVTAQSGGEEGNDAVGDVLTGIRHIMGTDAISGDTLIGDDHGNEIYGVDGHDLIIGGGGNDTLWGADHNDTLEGGAGADVLWGGKDFDMVSYRNASQGVRIDLRIQSNYADQVGAPGGEEKGDQLWFIDGVIGSAHDDTLIGGSVGEEACVSPIWGVYQVAANLLEGGAGDDLLMGLGGADTLDGGEGRDTADYSLSEDSVRVDLNLTGPQTGGGEVTETPSIISGSNPGILYGGKHARGDVLISIENVTGSAFNDTLVGNSDANILIGLDGDDSITAGAGDTVDGGAGTDVLSSGDATLDIATSTHISGIERIDLTGDAASLTVSGDAILNNGVADPLGGSAKALIVNGDGDDVVDFGSDAWAWQTLPDSQILDGKAYRVFEAAKDTETVRLYVQADMTVIGSIVLVDSGIEDLMPATEGPGYDDGFLESMRSRTADYSDSPAAVRVDLNLQDGVTAQSGGDPGNHADGDVLQNVRFLLGSNFDDTLICAKDGFLTHVLGLDGNDTMYGDGYGYYLEGGDGDDVLHGGLGNGFLYGGLLNGFLHGDAGDDILHLNLGNKSVLGGGTTILPEHIGELDGGDGFDTLVLGGYDGDGVTLDLSGFTRAGMISGIERLDITGDADDANTLTLRASDVLDTTGGADTLWVRGDANDTVTTTDTGWTHVGVETGADGRQYNHYSGYADSSLVNLMIDTDIAHQNVMHA
jgi:Ca2+-binding RTX toxin-like protein